MPSPSSTQPTTPAQTLGAPPGGLAAAPAGQAKVLSAQYGVTDLGAVTPTLLPGATLTPFHSNATTAPAHWVKPAIPELWIQLAASTQTGGVYSLTSMLFPSPGNAAAPLSYTSHDESYYILDGKATFLLGDHPEPVGKGAFVFVPRGTVFGLRVDGKEGEKMRALVWHTPGGIIEGCLTLMGGVAAGEGEGEREKVPQDLRGPQVDPMVFMGRAKEMGIRILAVGDPLKV
jgi:mannose-6-phosphate isomerase-like protein (cupin superfamily)